jgi:hypothetical protein
MQLEGSSTTQEIPGHREERSNANSTRHEHMVASTLRKREVVARRRNVSDSADVKVFMNPSRRAAPLVLPFDRDTVHRVVIGIAAQ